MPNVKCSLESCGHRKKNGYCSRRNIELSNEEFGGNNELYCLSFDMPGMRIFKMAITGDPDIFQKDTTSTRDPKVVRPTMLTQLNPYFAFWEQPQINPT